MKLVLVFSLALVGCTAQTSDATQQAYMRGLEAAFQFCDEFSKVTAMKATAAPALCQGGNVYFVPDLKECK